MAPLQGAFFLGGVGFPGLRPGLVCLSLTGTKGLIELYEGDWLWEINLLVVVF